MGQIFYMGLSGSILIVVIICFRHFFPRQLPRRFLVILWLCAIIRLLLPVSVPVRRPAVFHTEAPVSVMWRSTASHSAGQPAGGQVPAVPDTDSVQPASTDIRRVTYVLSALWFVVAACLVIRTGRNHIRSVALYRTSLPVSPEKTGQWLRTHRSIRGVQLRQSDLVTGPLTYGIFRPVILLPSAITLDEEELICVLEHEWIHILRWDVFVKYMLYLTVCLYWFHPLVWLMAGLLERDMEIACDEEVVKKYPDSFRKTYALTLIRLAQRRPDAVRSLHASFARHTETEERIRYIMKTKTSAKKVSLKAVLLAIGMAGCTMTAFTVSAQKTPEAAAVDTSIQKGQRRIETKSEGQSTAKIYGQGAQALAQESDEKAPDTQSVARKQLVEMAKKYVGNPYRYGGTDLYTGVDSPGFIKAIYALAGIELPASLKELAAAGTRIQLSELAEGDLIFYTEADGGGQLCHAAIYIGGGQAIHASNMREGIKISDYDYREIGMAARILN